MNKIKNFGIISLVVNALMACSTQVATTNTSTVKVLDLNRYLGTWYEIARFDHRFERGMDGCKAHYSLQEDGLIKVVNSGYKNGDKAQYKEAVGKAKRPNSSEQGKLKVSFFWIFYGDYYVLELADDYRYALIGSSSDRYLWILSRTPKMNETDLNHLLQKAKERGYDTQKLIWVKQDE